MEDKRFQFEFFGGDWYPSYSGEWPGKKPLSKKRVLTGKEMAKRKAKRKMATNSRKVNRK